ncbi:MAG: 8-amino-7-oxononanoate synthase [Spirochaetes bacterium GWB1_36_13]|nr:MAG: 8-amino-7-oxononanoate synthase [Spirochaetes bacterium GWB1_36_13]
MDFFQKCYNFTEAKKFMEMGLYPYFREIESAQDTEVFIHNKKMIMLGSNSYLGLTTHPEVKEAAIKAIEKYGTGNAGSRFLNGTLDLHEELEKKLAEFVGKEDSLLYSTGFQTNLGVLAGLTISRDLSISRDVIFIDKMAHASIYDATRLSFAKKVVKYEHNDMADLEKKLEKFANDGGGKLIVTDGIFSMEGDILKLPELVKIAEKYKARVMVDDAHATGVLGPHGEGTAFHFDMTDKVDLIMMTFSKSFASLGGAICGEKDVIHYLRHHSRPLIFSASMPPSAVATVLKSLEIMKREPERVTRLWDITKKMLKELHAMGFETGVAETPIIPLITKDMELTFKFWKMVTDQGLFVNPVVPPAVPDGSCLIRTSYMATHTDAQLDFALEVFKKTGKILGIL